MNFKFVEDMGGLKIVYAKYPTNLLFFAQGGFGLTKDDRVIAKKILDFLNSLPDEETIPYPYNQK